MRINELYRDAAKRLRRVGLESPSIEAALLIEYCFGLSRTQLILAGEQTAEPEALKLFAQVLNRRLAREPLNYITGSREFWSLDFIVSPAVLIPRPETEFLLTHIFSLIKKNDFRGRLLLDMCTGSGVIATVLARELEHSRVVAVDCSVQALRIAARNLARHDTRQAVSLVGADLFSALQPKAVFDLLVANPPYIAMRDFISLQPEVRDWEPESALLAGRSGLDIIRQIAEQAHLFVKPGGWVFLEIGADQQDAVSRLFLEELNGKQPAYLDVEVVADWAGRPRVLQARVNA